MSKQPATTRADRAGAAGRLGRARRLRRAAPRAEGSRGSTSSPRARSPRATCTWATSATTRSATPTPASAAPAATRSCFGFGFDAFGLPAELAAIERQEPPADWVAAVRRADARADEAARLLLRLRPRLLQLRRGPVPLVAVALPDPAEMGMIYLDDATVDWCDTCNTTLASIQVEDGRCWRCHNEVRLIRRPTWFLRITPYLEENDANTEQLQNWDELALATQRYILGRTDGVELDLEGERRHAHRLHPAPPSRSGSPASSCSRRATPRSTPGSASGAVREELEQMRSGGWERSARDARSVPVLDTGATSPAPGGERAAGPGLAAGRRPLRPDRGARHPRRRRGRPRHRRPRRAGRRPRPSRRGGRGGAGPALRSRAPARPSATAPTTSRSRASAPGGRRSRSSTARSCGPVPVPEADLPVVLPRDIMPTGEGNPLAERPDFVDVDLPQLRRARQARDRHPRLPLRRALALGSGGGPARGPGRADVHPPRPARVAARRAPGRRRRQRRLRLRPADRDQGAARPRPLRLHRERRALRRLPLPRDGDRRRAQDEQAPRQRRQPRRAGRAVRRRHRPARRPLRGRARRRR